MESFQRTFSLSNIQYQFSVFGESMSEVRKLRRNKLVKIRLILCKVLLFLSLSSLTLMVVNNQLFIIGQYEICSRTSMTIKVLVSALSALLLFSVWIFSYVQLLIFMNLRGIDSVATAIQLNYFRIFGVIIESVISVLNPLPICYPGTAFITAKENSAISSMPDKDIIWNVTTPLPLSAVAEEEQTRGYVELGGAESLLSILAFLRLYHVGRFTVLHSKLFRTMLSYSLGALAHTKYNIAFIFKSYMAIYKGYFLASLALSYAAIAAWCIYISDPHINKYQDALWVVAITFFTVGYGDISPRRKSAQIISVMTGFVGMFCMGVSVSILSRYLQLTFDEYCMLSFFIDCDLEKQRRAASANIIIAAWQDYRSRKSLAPTSRIKAQKKLMKAIHQKRNIELMKVSSRERRERQVPLYDMKEVLKKLLHRTEAMQNRQTKTEDELQTLLQQLVTMRQKLTTLATVLQSQ